MDQGFGSDIFLGRGRGADNKLGSTRVLIGTRGQTSRGRNGGKNMTFLVGGVKGRRERALPSEGNPSTFCRQVIIVGMRGGEGGDVRGLCWEGSSAGARLAECRQRHQP